MNRYSLKYGTFNFRCSMSILVRAELDCNCHALIPSYPNTKTREVFGILVQDPIDGRQIAVYNIHAPSGNSAFAKAYFQYALTEIDKLVTQHNISNVVLIGDFNNNPSMTSEELKNAVTKLRYTSVRDNKLCLKALSCIYIRDIVAWQPSIYHGWLLRQNPHVKDAMLEKTQLFRIFDNVSSKCLGLVVKETVCP